MRQFSKEEIRLCKLIAEKKKRETSKGDWWIDSFTDYPKPILAQGNISIKSCIPLWQENDCLEWLRKECKHEIFLSYDESSNWWLWFDEYEPTQQSGSGKTPLEALLRAVLAVLKA